MEVDESFQNCSQNLDRLIKWYDNNKGNRNEATTRFQLIDRLFLECLDWERDDIVTEQQYNGKYSDYSFNLIRTVFILEAKKEGISFEIPIAKENTFYSLRPLSENNQQLKEHIDQVSSYCQKRGIEIGGISNGWQLIMFVANRIDGTPPLDGKALVFSSLGIIRKNFTKFYNFLSKEGLAKNTLRNVLLGETTPKLPIKLSATLKNYPGIKNRNTFQTDLQIISEIVLEDVQKNRNIEKDFLEACYCKSGALSQYALISKKILNTRYKYLFEKNQENLSLKPAKNKKGLDTDLSDIISISLSRRPILLIGDVGVGKTIFINNLIIVEGSNVFENSLTFRIDLGSNAILTSKMKIEILNIIEEKLLTDYRIDINEESFVRGVYHKELVRFKSGIYKKLFESYSEQAIIKEIEFLEKKTGNTIEHLKNSLVHISQARKKQIVIFIDNVDQRNDETQQDAFLISQEFAEHWPVTVFLALRPETFHRSLNVGALSGYHPKAFTISPPRIDEVLDKRLNFAQKITRGDLFLTQFDGKLKVTFSKLDSLIEVIKYSFSNNRYLMELIDNISNGNVRQAIDLVKSFFGSGHVDTKKIVDIYEHKDSYLVPVHEFLRAVIYGDGIYYDPKSSPIVNLFDINYNDDKEHFLCLIILQILDNHLSTGKNEGFLETNLLYDYLQNYGFSTKQIDQMLYKLLLKKLIETSQRGSLIQTDNLPQMLRCTTIGIYHLKNLSVKFVYIDAITIDTPIFNEEFRPKIKESKLIQNRLERVLIFKNYLDNIWLNNNIIHDSLDWQNMSKQLEDNVKTIHSKIVST